MNYLNSVRNKSQKWPSLFLNPDANVSHLLREQVDSLTSIVTFSRRIDQALRGGVRLGQITEIDGASGVGKSQLCFQLAVDVQIPKSLGGVGGAALFVDTENSFNTNRLISIAEGVVEYCTKYSNTSEEKRCASEFTIKSILSNVFHRKCKDVDELVRLSISLNEYVRINDQIKLVIIDSVTFPFRFADDQVLGDKYRRCKLREQLKCALLQLAIRRNVAVVITNHATTKFTDRGVGYEEAALNFNCDCASTIYLSNCTNVGRFACLSKSTFKPTMCIPFKIEEKGIRDADVDATSNVEHLLLSQMQEFSTQSIPQLDVDSEDLFPD